MNKIETKPFSALDVIEEKAPYKLGECLPPVHVDSESAYQIADYPYGRQRTIKKIWIHTNKKNQQRIMTQTLNPKTGNWNKPKASTYSEIKVLYVDSEKGHIQNDAFSLAYGDANKFLAEYESVISDDHKKILLFKIEYDRLMNEAKPLDYGTPKYIKSHKESFMQALKISGRIVSLSER